MKPTLIALAIAIAAVSGAQNSSITPGKDGIVAVSSRGNDVRTVVHDLFSQLGKNYILDPSVRLQPLYLSLKDVEFEEALFQICKLADLKFDVQNGIFYINRAPKPAAKPAEPKAGENHSIAKPKIEEKPALRGPYSTQVLTKKVTTRLEKVDLRDLVADLAKQTGLTLTVDSKVPRYRIDAYLINTSLKYALDQITQAANLRYRFTNNQSIEIVPAVVAAEIDNGRQPGKSGQ